MKNETKSEKENFDERPFTFKITKKRSPWTSEEDEAITALVNKYGTGNWTLIANEMSNLYGYKNRSGKQCRERWHNHLDPNINKDYWSEKEENVLFMKHMEYGNKWSDIAKFLPGRTDNAIKNHFYSKLRKFIRKMLKQINKDNLLKANGIDPNKYNSDRVYKMIKKNKIAYNNLNKEAILAMIINYEKNHKIGKNEMHMLKNKTNRRKSKGLSSNLKENLYDEKINKRKGTYPSGNLTGYEDAIPAMATRTRSRAKTSTQKLNDINNDYINYNNYNNFLTGAPQNQMSLYNNMTNITTRSRRSKNENIYTMPRSRRNLRKRNLDDDFLYEEEQMSGAMRETNNEDNGKDLAKRNLNMIINKSVLFNNYVKEEEERRSSSMKSVEFTPNKYVQKDVFFPSAAFSHVSNVNLMPSTSSQSNFLFDDRMYRTSNNFDTFPYIDQGIPLMSPINPNTKLYPTSTRNYFNIDLLNEGNYHIPLSMQNYNMFRQPGGILHSGYMTSPGNYDMAGLSLTPNKEIALHNKILINESDLIGMQNYNLARNSNYQLLEASKKEEYKNDMKNMNISASAASGSSNNNVNNLIDYSEIQNHKRKLSEMNRKPSLDLTKINENEVGKFFQQSLVRKESDSNNNMPSDSKASLNLQLPSEFSAIAMKAEEAPARTDDKEQDIYQPSKSDSENIREDSKSISNDNNEDYQIVPIQEGDRFHTEEYKEHLQGDSSHVSKNYDTISVSNTSVKSFNEENNSILINESNINRYDVLNMYNTSNVNRDNITNKSTVDMTNLTPQQLQQMQQHETKAILNISPKSAFVKMKCIQKN